MYSYYRMNSTYKLNTQIEREPHHYFLKFFFRLILFNNLINVYTFYKLEHMIEKSFKNPTNSACVLF